MEAKGRAHNVQKTLQWWAERSEEIPTLNSEVNLIQFIEGPIFLSKIEYICFRIYNFTEVKKNACCSEQNEF